MKIKFILALSLILLSIYTNSFAISNPGYHKKNCNFKGLREHDVPETVEFAWLFADRNSEDFKKISAAIAILAITEPSVLNDPECSAYKYARAFLEYYHKNKIKIPKDGLYITKILDIVEETTKEIQPQEIPDL